VAAPRLAATTGMPHSTSTGTSTALQTLAAGDCSHCCLVVDGVGLMVGLVGGGRVVLVHLLLAQTLSAAIHMLQNTGGGHCRRWP